MAGRDSERVIYGSEALGYVCRHGTQLGWREEFEDTQPHNWRAQQTFGG